MKRKLKQIHSRPRRLFISIVLQCLHWLDQFSPRRARAHWIGYRRRPVRIERFLAATVFCSAWILLEPREVATWSVFAGGTTSLFVVFATIYSFLPRKRYHWI